MTSGLIDGLCSVSGASEEDLMESHVGYVSCLGSVICPSEAVKFASSLEKGSAEAADAAFSEISSRVWRCVCVCVPACVSPHGGRGSEWRCESLSMHHACRVLHIPTLLCLVSCALNPLSSSVALCRRPSVNRVVHRLQIQAHGHQAGE